MMKRNVRSVGLVLASLAGSVLLAGSTAHAQVANDSASGALVVTSLPYSNSQDTALATVDPGEPPPCSGDGSHSVWYAYTAGASGALQADTLGSDYDTVLGVFAAGPGGGLAPVGCNDDSQCSLQSSVVFDAVAGQTYYFRVTNYLDDTFRGSALTFHLGAPTPTPPPPPPLTASVTLDPSSLVSPSNGVVRLTGTVTCSQSASYNLLVSAEQQTGRGTTAANAFVGGACGPTATPWSATFTAFTGRFVPGALTVSANGSAFAFSTCGGPTTAPLSVGATITLRGTAAKNLPAPPVVCRQPPSSGTGTVTPPPPPR